MERATVVSYVVDGYDLAGNNVVHDVTDACPVRGPIERPCPTRHGQKVTIDTGDLPSGPVRFVAKSTDVTGNVSDPVEWIVFIDRRPPVGRASGDLTRLEGERTSEDGPVEVVLEGRDTFGGSGVAQLLLEAVDGEGNSVVLARESTCDEEAHSGELPCPQSVKRSVSVDLTSLPDGPTRFRVAAKDLAGSVSTDSETWETYVDQTAPQPPRSIQVKRKTEDSAVISWERPPDVDVDNYEFQVFINGQPIDTWQLTPYPQAVIPVASNATVSIILRSIDKAMNRSANTNKTGRLSGVERLLEFKKKNPRFHPCEGGKGARCGHYNGKKAAAYARKYATPPYNANYPPYFEVPEDEEGGGDCTNFASQALHAGGMKFIGDHKTADGVAWYGEPKAWTKAWVNAITFHTHFVDGDYARGRQLHSGEKVHRGDIIQIIDVEATKNNEGYPIYVHSVIVSMFKGKGEERRRVSYHTQDTRDLKWNIFKDRMNKWLGKGNWTHIVIRPQYTGVNIR